MNEDLWSVVCPFLYVTEWIELRKSSRHVPPCHVTLQRKVELQINRELSGLSMPDAHQLSWMIRTLCDCLDQSQSVKLTLCLHQAHDDVWAMVTHAEYLMQIMQFVRDYLYEHVIMDPLFIELRDRYNDCSLTAHFIGSMFQAEKTFIMALDELEVFMPLTGKVSTRSPKRRKL